MSTLVTNIGELVTCDGTGEGGVGAMPWPGPQAGSGVGACPQPAIVARR